MTQPQADQIRKLAEKYQLPAEPKLNHHVRALEYMAANTDMLADEERSFQTRKALKSNAISLHYAASILKTHRKLIADILKIIGK